MKATGGATAHALMTAHRKTKDNWVMDGILHASALEQMGPRSQPVSSTYEQVKFGKLSQLWKNLPPHSYTHTHTHIMGPLQFWKPADLLSVTIRFSCLLAAAAKSRQSCPTLCNPMDGTQQAPPSLGFSRQEYCLLSQQNMLTLDLVVHF